jgi:uncharacterized protein YjeT (DUF2065 family)
LLDALWGALALLLVLEGLLPLCSPQSWRRAFERALQLKDGQLRFIGMLSVLAGLLIAVLLSTGA